jgi:cytidylate kinase
MRRTAPFVITISRQLGSGGAYVGQQLADKLNVFYADREIICQAAEELSLLEEELQLRDEKNTSFWQKCLQSCAFCAPESYIPPQLFITTDKQLFTAETKVIQRIAKERSAVIIGRSGSYILRNHPNHVSIFLHADINFRKERIKSLYNVSEEESVKMLTKSDKERARHYHSHTGEMWTDATKYDISLDTSKIGLDKCIEIILEYIE